MSSEEKFIHESVQDPQTIKEYLESLEEGFDNRRIVLESEGRQLLLTPEDMLKFTIKAKKKGGVSKLTLKLEWKDQKKKSSEKEPGEISISS